jgi:hypothetical protein
MMAQDLISEQERRAVVPGFGVRRGGGKLQARARNNHPAIMLAC